MPYQNFHAGRFVDSSLLSDGERAAVDCDEESLLERVKSCREGETRRRSSTTVVRSASAGLKRCLQFMSSVFAVPGNYQQVMLSLMNCEYILPQLISFRLRLN